MRSQWITRARRLLARPGCIGGLWACALDLVSDRWTLGGLELGSPLIFFGAQKIGFNPC